jgi:hypothetical protein
VLSLGGVLSLIEKLAKGRDDMGVRRKKKVTAGSKNGEGNRERLSDRATVYTTPYGVQYVLPTDLLFSREDKLRLLREAQARVAHSKAKYGK